MREEKSYSTTVEGFDGKERERERAVLFLGKMEETEQRSEGFL